MESDEVRAIRRALSAALTAEINDVAHHAEIRMQVILALAGLDQRLQEVNDYARDKFLLDPDRVLVRFYMKGGNAFKCAFNPGGNEATKDGGGTSDWDTQVIVDPWAPLPIQAQLYARIEEILMDEMVKVGVAIADVAKPGFPGNGQPFDLMVKDPANKEVTYKVTCDDPQTFRQVYDWNRIGMWMNGRRKLNDEQVKDSELIPGILFNDAIAPFALYRLGYTWHGEPVTKTQVTPPQVARPILMELIDVTLPRRDTIEAVSVWEELETEILKVTPSQVIVDVPNNGVGVILPLPGLSYHLHEIATMLCEVADNSSHHKDKLPKRFERFAQILDLGRVPDEQATHLLSALAGVFDIKTKQVAPVRQVDDAIQQYAPTYVVSTNDSVKLAKKLMYIIASRRPFDLDQPAVNYLIARKAFAQIFGMAGLANYVDAVAFTDDLVLRGLLSENGYVQIDKLNTSGVDQEALLRLKPGITPNDVAGQLRTAFETGGKRKSSGIDWDTVPFIIDTAVRRIVEELAAGKLTVRSRAHNTVRPSGVTNEHTLVVFNNGRAVICITLTSATALEAPFRVDPGDKVTLYASLPDLANQRKVAAALIEDYTIRNVIAKQYDALKWLLPGV